MVSTPVRCWLLAALAVAAAVADRTTRGEDGIYDFREDKVFDDVIEGQRVVAVFYHDPHLASSESVLHEFRLAAKQLHEEGVTIGFGYVDVTNKNTRGLLRRFGIFRVPTILVFHESVPYHFYGNVTKVGLVDKLREHAADDWKSDRGDGAVEELTDGTIEDFIQSRRAAMVMFYAPWCNHCKQFEPAYAEAADAMQKHKPAVPLGRLDGSKYGNTATQYNVSGFPTLALFRNGVETRYDGARSHTDLIKWIKLKTSPASTEIKPLAGAAKKFGTIARDAAVVGFLANDDVAEASLYHDLADTFRQDFKFGHMMGERAMAIAQQEFGVTSDSFALVIIRDQRLPIRKGEKKYAVFPESDSFDPEAGRLFVIEKYHSLVNFARKSHWMQRFAPTRPLVITLTDVDWETTRLIQHEIDQLAELAEKNPNITFAVGDTEELSDLAPSLGFIDRDDDVVACFLPDTDSRYPLPGAFTAERLTEHLERFERGELKPYIRSQKEPSRNPGPVKTLVASAFDRLAGDVTKDVVVVFVSSVSSDCQKFEVVLKKAHKQLAADNVLFFRYDGDLNDLPPGVAVKSSPTMVIWPAGRGRSDKPEVYTGRRRIDSIIGFIKKHATTLQSEKHDEL